MRRFLTFLLLVVAAIGAYRWWITRPQPEPPEFIWTRHPFRGPQAHAEAGKHPPLDFTLGTTTPEPLVEQLAAVPPDARVYLRQASGSAIKIAESLSWREPFSSYSEMTPAQLAPWRLRWYVYTGETVTIGPKRWAKYQREDAAASAAK